MEVDLHINQLVKSTKGMANHDMLTLQLNTAKRQLDFAIKNRIQKIVFIHGVGEGVLKLELDYLFDRYNNVKHYDANYQKYGLGATEVYIYQNILSLQKMEELILNNPFLAIKLMRRMLYITSMRLRKAGDRISELL